jgi:hypothetical protein
MKLRSSVRARSRGALFVALALAAVSARAEPARRVLIVGDSIMNLLARSMERALAGVPEIEATSFTSLGSGLARLDLFDWHGKIESLLREHRPDILVVMMGANDGQPMRTDAGVAAPDTPEWETEYARRVARVFDLAEAGGVKRVLWLELPDMREAKVQAHAERVNAIFRAEAARRPGVARFIETRPVLSREPGQFSLYILQRDGMPLEVRSRDGIHLNRQGADRLAEVIVRLLKSDLPEKETP